MQFSFGLQSSLLLIFFVHIVVYAVMLLWRGLKQDSLSDSLLSAFLMVAALFIVPWMTGFAGWYEPHTLYREILFYTPFVHGLFIGPLLYLYLKALTNFDYRLKRRDWLHLLPGMLYIIWCAAVVIVDKFIVGHYYLMNGRNDPDFDVWYQILQKASIAIYLLATIKYYQQYKKYIQLEVSFADGVHFGWLKNFLLAFAVITFLPLVQDLLELLPYFENLGDYVLSWYYFMAFAVVVYYIAINGYHAESKQRQRLHFEPGVLQQYQQVSPPSESIPLALGQHPTYKEAKPITTDDEAGLMAWKEKITSNMEMDRLYEDAELTLTQLAKKMGSNNSVISKVINQGFSQNFNDFVNRYRIEAVQQRLKIGEHKQQTLLSIAFACGFNSKATFNRAFKKQTGLSPKDWLEKNSILLDEHL
jgi:AraC-like DNA-binding protein